MVRLVVKSDQSETPESREKEYLANRIRHLYLTNSIRPFGFCVGQWPTMQYWTVAKHNFLIEGHFYHYSRSG